MLSPEEKAALMQKFAASYPDTITNAAGQTFRVGQKVRNTDGWVGIVQKIKTGRSLVCPLLYVECAGLEYLQAAAAENDKLARDWFYRRLITARENGLSMGNYTPIN
jgi:hypothetical protein